MLTFLGSVWLPKTPRLVHADDTPTGKGRAGEGREGYILSVVVKSHDEYVKSLYRSAVVIKLMKKRDTTSVYIYFCHHDLPFR